ncbi:hypothetical protein DV736_g6611, partial [Chaetothyriales sp. CBS 134916]
MGTPLAGTKSKKRKAKYDGDKEIVNNVKRNRRASNSGSSGLMVGKRKASNQAQGATKRKPKDKLIINKAPTKHLDIYVFGAGEMGELGLGRAQGQDEVKRPWLNPLLAADKIGVVSLSVDTGLNFKESTPSAVDTAGLPVDIVWTQLTCTDSATFALTDNGNVYGWGTFRGNEVPGLHNILQLAGGSNHVLALSNKGEVYAWGAGQQNQLSRRIIERRKLNGLVPTRVGLPKKIVLIGAGSYHSFAVTESGEVYSWGLNSFGETGIAAQIGDGEESDVHQATIVKSLRKFGKITCIDGGSHHTVAVTNEGELLVWGRLDGFQLGLQLSSLPERDVIRDSAGHLRILKNPTQIPNIDAVYASAGSDHCVAVARDGKAYAWGFSENYQTGLGTKKDVELATQIDKHDRDVDVSKTALNGNDDSDISDEEDSIPTANAKNDGDGIRGKKMVWAGCGGQFSILAGLAAAKPTDLNGVNGYA